MGAKTRRPTYGRKNSPADFTGREYSGVLVLRSRFWWYLVFSGGGGGLVEVELAGDRGVRTSGGVVEVVVGWCLVFGRWQARWMDGLVTCSLQTASRGAKKGHARI